MNMDTDHLYYQTFLNKKLPKESIILSQNLNHGDWIEIVTALYEFQNNEWNHIPNDNATNDAVWPKTINATMMAVMKVEK